MTSLRDRWEPWEDRILLDRPFKEALEALSHRTMWSARKRKADIKRGTGYIRCNCGSTLSKIVNTTGCVRRRKCIDCGFTFQTSEERIA